MSDNIMQTDGDFNSQETLKNDTSSLDDILGMLSEKGLHTGGGVDNVYSKQSSPPVSKPPSKEYGDSIKTNVQEEKPVNNTASSLGNTSGNSSSENTSDSEFAQHVASTRKSFSGYDMTLKDLQTEYNDKRSVNYAVKSREELGNVRYTLEDRMRFCRGYRDAVEKLMTDLDSEEYASIQDGDYKLKDDLRKELKAYLGEFTDIHDKLNQLANLIDRTIADKSNTSENTSNVDSEGDESDNNMSDDINNIPGEGDYVPGEDYDPDVYDFDNEGDDESDLDSGMSDNDFSQEELAAAGEALELGDDDSDDLPFQNINSNPEEVSHKEEIQKPVTNSIEKPAAVNESETKASETVSPCKHKTNIKLRANLINIDARGRDKIVRDYAASFAGVSTPEAKRRIDGLDELGGGKGTISSDVNSYIIRLIKMRFATHINTLEDDKLRASILDSFRTQCNNASCVEDLPNSPLVNAFLLYTLQLSGFNVFESDMIGNREIEGIGSLSKSAKVIFMAMYKSEFDISGDGFLRVAGIMNALDESIDDMFENVKEGNHRAEALKGFLRKIDIKLSWLCALNEHAAETEFDMNTNDFRGGKFMMKNIDQFVGYFDALDKQTNSFYKNTKSKAARH